ncbi:MAG: hypothetical protein AAFY73_10100 [Pseudomonadota bacterium]
MARIRSPRLFSSEYGIDPSRLNALGVLDLTLNVDTRLFIDPMLLEASVHPEIAQNAKASYDAHFARIIQFLKRVARPHPSDVAWRTAKRLLSFPEVKWTCLGYGSGSVSGSGSGGELTSQYVETARQIVALGVDDPDLFVAMALFEEGVGPDRISDMATNVILGDLLEFNKRVLGELGVPVRRYDLQLANGNEYQAELPRNPCIPGNEPVVLVPTDVLRDLPIATDWSSVADAASKNASLRGRVNRQITKLWKIKSRKDKEAIRSWALSGKTSFEDFLVMVRSVEGAPYDIDNDPAGEVFWRTLGATVARNCPLQLTNPSTLDGDGINGIVLQIIEQFRFLIENRRISEELYHGGRPRPEKSAQRLFFIVADAYCKANNLDITPEADTGNGPVDFKVSQGYTGRVLVEIKLSTNPKVVQGYSRQLKTYAAAEQTDRAHYVVIDVGGMGNKDQRLIAEKNEAASSGKRASEIHIIDGTRRPSASKL